MPRTQSAPANSPKESRVSPRTPHPSSHTEKTPQDAVRPPTSDATEPALPHRLMRRSSVRMGKRKREPDDVIEISSDDETSLPSAPELASPKNLMGRSSVRMGKRKREPDDIVEISSDEEALLSQHYAPPGLQEQVRTLKLVSGDFIHFGQSFLLTLFDLFWARLQENEKLQRDYDRSMKEVGRYRSLKLLKEAMAQVAASKNNSTDGGLTLVHNLLLKQKVN